MADGTFTSGAILSRSFDLLRGNAKMAAIAVVVLAVANLANGAISTAATIFAQYTIISGILSQADLMPDGYRTRRFLAILGVCILSNVGIALGLVLLIVPGVFLAVRWVLCVPVLIGEETGVIEALQRSWQETAGRFWPIFTALLAIFAPLVVVVGIVIAMTMANGGANPSLGVTLAANLVSSAVVVFSWHASAAIYAMLRSGTPGIEEVFA